MWYLSSFIIKSTNWKPPKTYVIKWPIFIQTGKYLGENWPLKLVPTPHQYFGHSGAPDYSNEYSTIHGYKLYYHATSLFLPYLFAFDKLNLELIWKVLIHCNWNRRWKKERCYIWEATQKLYLCSHSSWNLWFVGTKGTQVYQRNWKEDTRKNRQ